MKTDDLVFVGFNSRVAALDKKRGEIVWDWQATKGRGSVTLLVDGDYLFVSVMGYSYCLDARTGEERWFNEMSGFGFGVPCVATSAGHSPHMLLQQSSQEDTNN